MELAKGFVIGDIVASVLGVLDEESGVRVQDVASAAEDEESPDSIRVGEDGVDDRVVELLLSPHFAQEELALLHEPRVRGLYGVDLRRSEEHTSELQSR